MLEYIETVIEGENKWEYDLILRLGMVVEKFDSSPGNHAVFIIAVVREEKWNN